MKACGIWPKLNQRKSGKKLRQWREPSTQKANLKKIFIHPSTPRVIYGPGQSGGEENGEGEKANGKAWQPGNSRPCVAEYLVTWEEVGMGEKTDGVQVPKMPSHLEGFVASALPTVCIP